MLVGSKGSTEAETIFCITTVNNLFFNTIIYILLYLLFFDFLVICYSWIFCFNFIKNCYDIRLIRIKIKRLLKRLRNIK